MQHAKYGMLVRKCSIIMCYHFWPLAIITIVDPETCIICIHSGEDCGRVYKLLRIHLGGKFTIPEGEEVIPGKRYRTFI